MSILNNGICTINYNVLIIPHKKPNDVPKAELETKMTIQSVFMAPDKVSAF
jgi:hypothetical protein